MEIKNLKKAANRILKAIRQNEEIILYGDTDLDGVASVIILKETIKNLAPTPKFGVEVYFPDREIEGYGISERGLNYLKPQLLKGGGRVILIALDCGIGNFKEVKLAKKMGFEVIIIDHHEILDGLPEAEIIVDPKQKGDRYPFKGLATAGIAFKLSVVLLGKKITENLRKSFLELTALATIADMMPKENENLEFINLGLKSLENSWRPGIRAFFEVKAFKYLSSSAKPVAETSFLLPPSSSFHEGSASEAADEAKSQRALNLNQKVSKIISLLNVRDVEDGLPAPFRLLVSPSLTESEKLIERLIEKNKFRKEKIYETVAEIEKWLERKKASIIIFEGDSNLEFTLISSVASIICHKYQKPTFIFKILEKESQGTVRTPKGIDSVALMKKCKSSLITYGGHPQASGFRIKNENLEKFKSCLIKNL